MNHTLFNSQVNKLAQEKEQVTKEKITIGTMFWILVILAIGALTVLFIFSHTVQGLLMSVVDFINSFTDPVLLGLVFFGIMIIQSLALPIPSEAVLMAGGFAFGSVFVDNLGLALLASSIVGYIGSICGALILFYLGRKGGRPLVIKVLGKSGMAFVDNWFIRWGGWAVGLGRLLPIIFFDPISLVAGATDIRFKHYIYGSLAGTVPRVIFYCGLGAGIMGTVGLTEDAFTIILLIIIAVGLIMLLIYWLMFRRYAKQQEKKKEEVSSA
jgi:uncharacterized membrane protein YdjX (TVP38/TMEM64 family)